MNMSAESRFGTLVQQDETSQQMQMDSYRQAMAELVDQYAQAQPVLPKPLTIPAIFGRGYDENFISDYLAYVLNPTKNGIGPAPLAQFLTLCGLDPERTPLTEVIIHREYTIGSGRIDLLLEWQNTLVIGIENKVLSAEGESQTKYYAREISLRFKKTRCHFVYLTRDGHKAQSGDFQPVSYAELLTALHNVSVTPDVGARQLILWYDFLEHLEAYITMNSPEQLKLSDKTMLYIEHQAMIQDLETTFKNEWRPVIDYLEGQVRAHLGDKPWQTNFSRTQYEWHSLAKSGWSLSKWWVSYYYFFSAAYFAQQKILFVLQVDGTGTKHFLDHFDQCYPALEAEYRRRGIVYRPSERKRAIGWKEYSITQDIDQIAQVFIEAFDEFSFLEPEVDRIMARMAETKGNSISG